MEATIWIFWSLLSWLAFAPSWDCRGLSPPRSCPLTMSDPWPESPNRLLPEKSLNSWESGNWTYTWAIYKVILIFFLLQRTKINARVDFPHYWIVRQNGPATKTHPHARVIWRLPLHGRCVSQRHPILWPHSFVLHAQKIPTRCSLFAKSPIEKSALIHCCPIGISWWIVGDQRRQANLHSIPCHGTFPFPHTVTQI